MYNFSESFTQHDKYQLELKFNYPASEKQKLNAYSVDAYIFLPNSLDVNSSTYTPTNFYTDVRDYIRLKTPALGLAEIGAGDSSPLALLSAGIQELADNAADGLDHYTKRLKMFSSIMKSSLRDEAEDVVAQLAAPAGRERFKQYLAAAAAILHNFRLLEKQLTAAEPPAAALELFHHADEFLSININKYRYQLWFALKDGQPAWKSDAQRKLVELCRAEIAYRKRRRYPSIPMVDGNNEELLYREGVLKKAMASVLFLNTATRKDGVLLENMIFGLAAGLAMTFAALIAYFTRDILMREFSLVVLLVLVIAYMGKDRVKELSKAYLYQKARRFMYDYKIKMYDASGREVGECREGFRFIKESEVPEVVSKVRNRVYLSNLENGCFGEQVILSRRRVKLKAEVRREFAGDFEIEGIVDIMRLNVRNFLMKMDNPERPVFVPDDTRETVHVVQGKRVYHVNIVMHYSMEGHEDRYTRYRLVLSRNGIKRINYVGDPDF
ncbi:MAG: hypothetical protein PHI85_02310 [Victivallaceae bacterium]|nr:hypothetical protein [Victivallaceae bacterium]